MKTLRLILYPTLALMLIIISFYELHSGRITDRYGLNSFTRVDHSIYFWLVVATQWVGAVVLAIFTIWEAKKR